jgi:hypothetical protein
LQRVINLTPPVLPADQVPTDAGKSHITAPASFIKQIVTMEIRNTAIGTFSVSEEKSLLAVMAAATGQKAKRISLQDLQYVPIKNVRVRKRYALKT